MNTQPPSPRRGTRTDGTPQPRVGGPRRPPAQSPIHPGSTGQQYAPPRNAAPQTVRRPQPPYGEPRPSVRPQPPRPDERERLLRAREAQGVQMQVQCCVPKKRRKKVHPGPILLLILIFLLVAAGLVVGGIAYHRHRQALDLAANAQTAGLQTSEEGLPVPVTTAPPETEPPGPAAVIAVPTSATVPAGEKVQSTHAVLIDMANGAILAERLSAERIFPASMTKVMTLIVAYESLESFDLTYTFTAGLINPLVEANASRAGFAAGETVPVIDLFYAAALPSGADATSALAELVAGSEAAFAERMNQKAAEMGLTGTHFTNASGLHDDNHYSTVREIAAIFSYAMQIEPLREILSTYQYTTAKTEQNPEGILLTSTLFSYLSGDELPGMKLTAGKTGYTLEARRCLVSMAVRDDGREFIAVVVGGENKWIPITDSIELYALCLPDAAEVSGTENTAP